MSLAFKSSIEKIAGLKCDVIITGHPNYAGMFVQQAAHTALNNPFIDPGGCRKYAAFAATGLAVRLASEHRTAPP